MWHYILKGRNLQLLCRLWTVVIVVVPVKWRVVIISKVQLTEHILASKSVT
jgi:hypothetical protein